ncbi:MAG: FxsA family protein [Mycobacteriales bacterium]
MVAVIALAVVLGYAAAEIVVGILVANAIGVLPTSGLLAAGCIAGVLLMRRIGGGFLRRSLATLAGEQPGAAGRHQPAPVEAVGSVVGVLGAGLIAVPGFLTDAIGLLLVLPPVRRVLGAFALAHLGRTVARFGRQATIRVGSTRAPDAADRGSTGTVAGGGAAVVEGQIVEDVPPDRPDPRR